MKISVQSLGLTPQAALEAYIERKLGKLDTFYDKVTDCKVFLKKENTSDGADKTAEVILSVPGDEIVVKKTCATFEESLDLCADAAKRQLIRRKETI